MSRAFLVGYSFLCHIYIAICRNVLGELAELHSYAGGAEDLDALQRPRRGTTGLYSRYRRARTGTPSMIGFGTVTGSSLIGVAIACTGNILISLAL